VPEELPRLPPLLPRLELTEGEDCLEDILDEDDISEVREDDRLE